MNKNEKASGTMVIVLWSVILLTVFLAILLDLGKNLEMRNVQKSMAQTSAEYGVKTIGTTGRLGAPAVQTAIKEYKRQRNDTITVGSTDSNTYPDYKVWSNPSCKVEVNGKKYTPPYFEATIYKKRGNDTNPMNFTINQGTGEATLKNGGSATPNVPYLRLDLTVYDAVGNMMLGVANIIPGIDQDFSCQQITTKVSAIAFASQGDIKEGSGAFAPSS